MFVQELKRMRKTSRLKGFLNTLFWKPALAPRVVIELSEGEAKTIGFKRERSLLVDLVETINLTADVYAKGEFKDEWSLGVLLKHLVRNASPRQVGALAIVPEEMIFTKIVQVKFGEIHTLENLVRQFLPLPWNEMVVTAKEIVPLSRQLTHKDFNVWAVERIYLESYQRALEAGAMAVLDFLPESLATVTALFPKGESFDASLIVVPQAKKIIILIFAGRAVHFSETLPGLEQLSRDPALEGMVVESVQEAIAFYRDKVLHEHGASSVVNRILVVGNLGENLEARLSLNSQLKVEHPDISSSFKFSSDFLKTKINENAAEFLPLLGGVLWLNKSR